MEKSMTVEELDRQARTLAKRINNTNIYDLNGMRDNLREEVRIRKEFVKLYGLDNE
jgi:hypothetical protein